MRKNLIPLLAIALVVAVLSTAVFYGLIADRLEPAKSAEANAGPPPTAMLVAARNIERGKLLESADVRLSDKNCPPGQPCVKDVADALGRATLDPLVEGQSLTEGSLSRPAGSSPSSVIPVGMRAVTMHVADSLGVVQMMRAGDRVDVQMILARENGALEVRGVLPAVEVLNVGPPEFGSPLTGRPVVTVLLSPADADRISLADTVGRLRVVLRNQKDVEKKDPETKDVEKAVSAATKTTLPVAPVPVAAVVRDIYFDVRWVSPKQVGTLELLGGHSGTEGDALQVQPVTTSWTTLEKEGRLAVVAKSQVLTRESGEVSLEREGTPGIRIRLEPKLRADGRLSVRVEPEVKTAGTERKIRSDLSFTAGQSFLVAGLEAPDGVFAVITPRVVARSQK